MTKKTETPIAAVTLTNELLDALKPNCYKDAVKQYATAQGVDVESISNLEEIYEILGAIQPVNLADYLVIRAKLNEAFMVGEIPLFAGSLSSTDTELGTLRHGFFSIFDNVVGKPFVGSDEVSYELRLNWRDELINELDQLMS